MQEMMSVDTLIKNARLKGVDFGKSDPYNRIRYYTKIGWLPHMVRKKDEFGGVKGHFNQDALDTIILIEKLKKKDKTNEEISAELDKLTAKKTVTEKLGVVAKAPEMRKWAFYAFLVFLVTLSLLAQLGIIRLNKPQPDSFNQLVVSNIRDKGVGFIPKETNKVFIDTKFVDTNSLIYVTFVGNYAPASRYWVAEIVSGSGFTIELDTNVSQSVSFNWWVLN